MADFFDPAVQFAPMLRELHSELGIPDDYGLDGIQPAFDERGNLVEVGPNLVGRMQRLSADTAASWQEMLAAARRTACCC